MKFHLVIEVLIIVTSILEIKMLNFREVSDLPKAPQLISGWAVMGIHVCQFKSWNPWLLSPQLPLFFFILSYFLLRSFPKSHC